MKKARRAVAIAAALVLALSLAGCGTMMEDSVQALVQGNLDEIYLGKYNEDFLQLVDITEAEAEQNYLDGLEVEAQYFAALFSIDYMTEELTAEIVDLYKEIYSHSRYEVGEATKVDDDTYGVPVTVYPIDVLQLAMDNLEAAATELQSQYTDEQIQAIINEDEAALQAYDADWAQMCIGLVREQLPNLGYLDAEEMVVQVTQDESDGLWVIADNDFQRIDNLMIYYPGT